MPKAPSSTPLFSTSTPTTLNAIIDPALARLIARPPIFVRLLQPSAWVVSPLALPPLPIFTPSRLHVHGYYTVSLPRRRPFPQSLFVFTYFRSTCRLTPRAHCPAGDCKVIQTEEYRYQEPVELYKEEFMDNTRYLTSEAYFR